LPRRLDKPNKPSALGSAWLTLLGLMLLAAAPLLLDISKPALFSVAEDRSVITADETHQRRLGYESTRFEIDAWKPIYLGQPRLEQPPGTTWLHMFALNGVTPTGLGSDAIKTRARLASAFMAILLVGGVFWAGHSIGGLTTATFAGAVALTMPVLVFFGRIATADMPLATWTALSVAAALWAMRPLRRNPSLIRQLLGWLICGLCMGMATLTGGPTAVPTVILPIIAIALICPHRLSHGMGIAAGLAIAALVVTPWSVHVHEETTPDVWQQWLDTLTPTFLTGGWARYLQAIGWRISAMLALTGWWAIWLIAALLQPFSTSSTEVRRRMLLGWTWYVTTSVLLIFAPGEPNIAGLLAVLAPAALIIGQVMRQFHELSAEGRHARLWRVNRWLMIFGTLCLSLLLPIWGGFETDLPQGLVAWTPWVGDVYANMHLSFWIGLTLVLVLAAGLAAKFALANHPGRALAAWALWALIAMSVLTIPVARGPLLATPATIPALPQAPAG